MVALLLALNALNVANSYVGRNVITAIADDARPPHAGTPARRGGPLVTLATAETLARAEFRDAQACLSRHRSPHRVRACALPAAKTRCRALRPPWPQRR